MSEDVERVSPDHWGHLPGYLDGATAVDAAQKLIDKGIFNDTPPTNNAMRAEAPAEKAAAAPEPPVAQAQPNAQVADEQGEQPAYADIEDYLAKSGVDRSSFFELPVTVKIDGKESKVPFSVALKNYQTDAHVTQRSQALSEKARAWEAEQATARTLLERNLQVAAQATQLAHQQLTSEFQGMDWNQLLAQDPGRYAAEQLRFQQRMGSIAQQFQQITGAQRELTAQSLQSEQTRLLEAFPDWKEPAKFQEAAKSLSDFAAAKYGVSSAEVNSLQSSVQIRVLHDAMQASRLQAENDALKAKLADKTEAALKQVRSAPPMATGGARISRDPKIANFQQARAAQRANPRSEAAQLAVAQALIDRGA